MEADMVRMVCGSNERMKVYRRELEEEDGIKKQRDASEKGRDATRNRGCQTDNVSVRGVTVPVLGAASPPAAEAITAVISDSSEASSAATLVRKSYNALLAAAMASNLPLQSCQKFQCRVLTPP